MKEKSVALHEIDKKPSEILVNDNAAALRS